jgi:hypothetical protein
MDQLSAANEEPIREIAELDRMADKSVINYPEA